MSSFLNVNTSSINEQIKLLEALSIKVDLKVDKETNKQLSTLDYNQSEKDKLIALNSTIVDINTTLKPTYVMGNISTTGGYVINYSECKSNNITYDPATKFFSFLQSGIYRIILKTQMSTDITNITINDTSDTYRTNKPHYRLIFNTAITTFTYPVADPLRSSDWVLPIPHTDSKIEECTFEFPLVFINAGAQCTLVMESAGSTGIPMEKENTYFAMWKEMDLM